ncbi:hypothetical protein [Halohasta litorea]|uniref:Uncharacterized protein n=1 Tax=Halohasta litorea TaxID=869891 RepID=A0ABD6D9C1_9EURY|nr:hypothetical protein [Halohasta litorea]
MGVSDALWEIESAIGDVFDQHGRDVDRQTAQARRNTYEQTLIDVNQWAGPEAMHSLSDWIEREIRTAERLPANHEVRQIGSEICRRTTTSNRSPPKL